MLVTFIVLFLSYISDWLMLNVCRKIPIWGFEAILRDGQVVGYIRRGEYAYSLGSFIGQGWVKVPYIHC